MTIGFLNLALLAGLAALAIPPIIHFLNRRRHDVVDWGAMQFLLVSPAKRRRFMIEEFLLLALRMGLIALLVLSFAAPYVSGPLVAGWTRSPRDTVLLLDGSYSMEQSDGKAPSPWQQARTWCDDWLKPAHAGDRVAVLLASNPPQSIVAELTADIAGVRESLEQLPRPTGNADWPRSLADAWNLLADYGHARRRDIILVTDHQKQGWADPATLAQWQALSGRLQTEAEARGGDPHFATPRLWTVTFGNNHAGANLRLAPLQTPRTVVGVGQRLRFATALHWDNHNAPPQVKSLRGKIGDVDIELPLAKQLDGNSGRMPVTFEHRFAARGVYLVSVIVEAAEGHDVLPADNRQDLVIEVVQELPVLLIDGDKQVSPESATFYLTRAFADPADKTKVSFIVPRVVAHVDFEPEILTNASTRPRVVVLADVPRLTEPQVASLMRFAESGGGLFIFLGPRAEQAFYNEQLHRAGQGLLPARLDGIETSKREAATTLDVKRFLHPALELFREEPNCTLGHASYTRWWKATVDTHGRGTPVALFANDDPWLIERTFGQGRILISTLPMDHSWDGHLPKTWEFPVLAHEIMFALADVRSGGFNLAPGQPLRIQPGTSDSRELATPMSITLLKQDGKASTRTATTWPFDWGAPGAPGVYQLQVGSGPRFPVVVHADPRESDLTPATDDERRQVAELLRLRELGEGPFPDDADSAGRTQEVWWNFLIGVMVLMCGELWLTRRMALARGRT